MIRAAWPTPATGLLDVISQAEQLGITLGLPDLVHRELVEHWIRDLHERRQSLQSKTTEFNDRAVGVLTVATPARLPEPYTMREAVREYTKGFTERFRSVPTTRRPLEDFLTLAMARGATFSEGGKGFQDAVILWSILDDMVAQGYKSAVIVSEDAAFKNNGVFELATSVGRTLKIISKLDELEILLRDNLSVRRREFLAAEKKALIDAVRPHQAELEAFLTSNLALRKDDVSAPGVVRRTLALQVIEIENAHRAWSWFKPKEQPESDNRISVDVRVAVRLEIEHFSPSEDPTFKVGDFHSPEYINLMASLRGPAITEHVCEVLVTVEAETEPADDGYGPIRFISVQVKRGLGELFRSLGNMRSE